MFNPLISSITDQGAKGKAIEKFVNRANNTKFGIPGKVIYGDLRPHNCFMKAFMALTHYLFGSWSDTFAARTLLENMNHVANSPISLPSDTIKLFIKSVEAVRNTYNPEGVEGPLCTYLDNVVKNLEGKIAEEAPVTPVSEERTYTVITSQPAAPSNNLEFFKYEEEILQYIEKGPRLDDVDFCSSRFKELKDKGLNPLDFMKYVLENKGSAFSEKVRGLAYNGGFFQKARLLAFLKMDLSAPVDASKQVKELRELALGLKGPYITIPSEEKAIEALNNMRDTWTDVYKLFFPNPDAAALITKDALDTILKERSLRSLSSQAKDALKDMDAYEFAIIALQHRDKLEKILKDEESLSCLRAQLKIMPRDETKATPLLDLALSGDDLIEKFYALVKNPHL